MTWAGLRVLVTGADGFIGSHLVEALIERGASVTALSAYDAFGRYGWLEDLGVEKLNGIRIVRGDIRDGEQMRELAHGQNVVFHLAALIGIPYSYQAPSSYVQTNIQGTVNVLNAARAAGVERVVHTSTSEVYGSARFTPMTEVHPLQAQSPYAASKAAADFIAESFFHSFGLPVVTLRPFNTFGPRQSERAVISSIIRQALDERCDEIHVGQLSPQRDFNYVSDIVAAFLAVADMGDSHLGQVFNAGSGVMVSIGDVAERILRLAAVSKPIVQDEERMRPANSEVLALMASADRLFNATAWQSRVALDTGLARTIDWWRSRVGRVPVTAHYLT